MIEKKIITGIIYTEFHDVHGTRPDVFIPDNLDEKLKILAGIKSISLLTGEDGFIPESLVFVPFSSYKLKAIIKYLNWDDESRRGGVGKGTITILFEEIDDVIFYKYKEDLEIACQEASNLIVELEIKKAEKKEFFEKIREISENLEKVFTQLRNKELAAKKIYSPELKPKDKDKCKTTYIFKIVVCGDASVGKSSLILRFTSNAFSRSYLPTLGVNISEKVFEFDQVNVQLVLWDIAGQDSFFMMRRQFYNGADGALLIFDLSRLDTLESIPKSYQDLISNLKDDNFPSFIIGNKNDLDKREVSIEEVQKLAKELGIEYFETSALTGDNVVEAFKQIAINLLKARNIIV